MHRLVSALILVLLAVWLPLQPSAALAMPFCKHGTEQAVHVENGHAETQHAHGNAHDPHAGGPGHLSCSDCGACHLACSPVLAVSVFVTASIEARRFETSHPLMPAAHLSDQPHPPPLLS